MLNVLILVMSNFTAQTLFVSNAIDLQIFSFPSKQTSRGEWRFTACKDNAGRDDVVYLRALRWSSSRMTCRERWVHWVSVRWSVGTRKCKIVLEFEVLFLLIVSFAFVFLSNDDDDDVVNFISTWRAQELGQQNKTTSSFCNFCLYFACIMRLAKIKVVTNIFFNNFTYFQKNFFFKSIGKSL